MNPEPPFGSIKLSNAQSYWLASQLAWGTDYLVMPFSDPPQFIFDLTGVEFEHWEPKIPATESLSIDVEREKWLKSLVGVEHPMLELFLSTSPRPR